MFGHAQERFQEPKGIDAVVRRGGNMEHFWEILTKPDNLPIVGMLLAVIFCLWVALSQALKHDRLIAQGKKDDVYSEMIK
jgi:hypothetical protein